MSTLLVSYGMFIVVILVIIAFFTLMERKILGLSQSRKGPSKVSFGGILQPIADAGKLFSKLYFTPKVSNKIIFSSGPAASLVVMLMLWTTHTSSQGRLDIEFSVMLFLTIVSLGVYPLFMAGWSSNNKYSTLGAFRGIAQTVSYEVSFAFIVMSMFISTHSLNFVTTTQFGVNSMSVSGVFAPLLPLWVISCLAETNRTPFDFSEGESELVSGFNTEYASALFALMFMAEYGTIAFFSMMTAIYISGTSMNSLSAVSLAVIFMATWVWIRATFPRLRYDLLMSFNWKIVLPSVLFLVTLLLGVAI